MDEQFGDAADYVAPVSTMMETVDLKNGTNGYNGGSGLTVVGCKQNQKKKSWHTNVILHMINSHKALVKMLPLIPHLVQSVLVTRASSQDCKRRI